MDGWTDGWIHRYIGRQTIQREKTQSCNQEPRRTLSRRMYRTTSNDERKRERERERERERATSGAFRLHPFDGQEDSAEKGGPAQKGVTPQIQLKMLCGGQQRPVSIPLEVRESLHCKAQTQTHAHTLTHACARTLCALPLRPWKGGRGGGREVETYSSKCSFQHGETALSVLVR